MGTIRAVVVLCFYLIIVSYFSLSAYTHHKPDAPVVYPTIAVIGTGYVGLVTGAGLASFGNKVICVDIAAEKIAQLNEGIIPIYEPDLKELVDYGIDQEQLSFTTDLEKVHNLMRGNIIIDARNLLHAEQVQSTDFTMMELVKQ